jgi:hypothetical protein
VDRRGITLLDLPNEIAKQFDMCGREKFNARKFIFDQY